MAALLGGAGAGASGGLAGMNLTGATSGELSGLASGLGGGSPFNGSGPFASFGGMGGMGGMKGSDMVGSMIGKAGAGGGTMKGGRASGKDMSDWAFKYYHDYESDPQGHPMQEGTGQLTTLTGLANNQPQKSPWEPILANNQNDVNTYIEQLMRKYHGQ